MTTLADHPTPTAIETDPEELLIGEIVDLDPETIEPLGDDLGDSTYGEQMYEALGSAVADAASTAGYPIEVEDEITSRYSRHG